MTARGLTMFGEYSMETASGREVNLLDPQPSSIYLGDIAHALSNQCRFNGHVRRFYSVAEHSVLVSRLIEHHFPHDVQLQLAGLMHDAAEAYIGDMISPVKFALQEFGAEGTSVPEHWAELEQSIETAIGQSLQLVTDQWHSSDVKRADWWALKIEATEVTFSRGRGWHWPANIEHLGHRPPAGVEWAGGQESFRAASSFLFRFAELTDG